jgi:hypothetical protein
MTGLAPDFAAENVGFFTAPYRQRAKLGKPVIDRVNKAVHVTLPNGVTRTAKYLGSQGCVTFPIGESAMNFKPVAVTSRLPDPATQLWPMGDMLPLDPLPAEIDAEKLKAAVNAAFQPAEGLTAAFVVTWKGRLIAERYAEAITAQTRSKAGPWARVLRQRSLAFWSKTASMIWTSRHRSLNGKRPATRAPKYALRISFTCRAGFGSGRPKTRIMTQRGPYPDHVYLYTGGIDSFHYAATRPLQWPPNTVGRYRNTDPVLINYLIRLGVEKSGDEYLSFPQRAAVRQARHPHHGDRN